MKKYNTIRNEINWELVKAFIGILSILLIIFLIYKMETKYRYKVSINRHTYYTNTKPVIYNEGKCINILNLDNESIDFCNKTFKIRE